MFTGVKTNSGTLGFDAHIIQNDETSIYNSTEVESIMLHAQVAKEFCRSNLPYFRE